MHSVRFTEPLVLFAFAVAAAMGCGDTGSTPRSFAGAGVVDSLECPNHKEGLPDGDTLLPIAGHLTTIAEFHDCQRLLNPEDTNSYSVLAGIWVSEVLDSLTDSIHTLNPNLDPALLQAKWLDENPGDTMPGLQGRAQPRGKDAPPPSPMGTGLTFALIYAWNGPYSPLGISQGWNCLVLFPAVSQSGYSAVIAPVDSAKKCEHGQRSNLQGDTLWVHSLGNGHLPRGNVPPVGRWDEDPVSGEQYIGVACGDAWCEVTRTRHYVSSPRYGIGNTGTPRQRAVFAIKGWYDEQRLAVHPAGNPSGPLLPAPFRGTVVPDARLDSLDVDDFRDKWVPAARMSLTANSVVYQAKYSLSQGKPPKGSPAMSMSQFELCREVSAGGCGSTGLSCPEKYRQPDGSMWFGRVIPVGAGEPKYVCVDRHDHSALGRHIPGTARWHWVREDEKLWVRCGEGCCPAN